jgi:DNA helicase HerA-like ATPase
VNDALAEARGYRLSLVLARQHLAQLAPDVRDAVDANARNKIFFRTSTDRPSTSRSCRSWCRSRGR